MPGNANKVNAIGRSADNTADDGSVVIEALQMQVAFLEDTVASLDEALATQQRQLHELQQQLRLLHGQLKEQGNRLDAMTETTDAPPPHY